MGGGHAAPIITQDCGPTIIISGKNDTFNAPGANLSGSNCTQGTHTKATGGTAKVKFAPTITAPGLQQLMTNLSQSGQHDIVHQTTTRLLHNLMIVNHPGVVIADQSVLYNQQPGVKFYNDTFENAGAKYYEAVLQNPGV